MLFELLYPLHTTYSAFNVFRYITFRTLLAGLAALTISLCLGPLLIRWLGSMKVGQNVRGDGPESHLAKAGTPTMGGTLILFSGLLATFLLADLHNSFVWLALLVTLGFGAIGFVDDYRKLRGHSSDGLSARGKLLLQGILGLAAGLFLATDPGFSTTLNFPLFKDFHPDLGWWYVPFAAFVLVGTSNAVNLTDGLDGLAIMPTVMVAAALGIFAYVSGHAQFADYLLIPHLPGTGELIVFCGALVGAGLGFLWFNTYPAQVFMGDVGALAVGAALGVVAVIVRQEIVLFIMGGVFVMETVSVILQVASFRLTGRRIFRMAPLHHHFELKGWPEPRVIVRFWVVTVVLVLVGLASLKLR